MNLLYKRNFFSVFIPIVLIAVLTTGYFPPDHAAADSGYQQFLQRAYTLRTSYNPAAYSVFTVSGDTVRASGNYERMKITDFYIYGCENSAKSFSRSGGEYAAEVTARASGGSDILVLIFDNGVSYNYRVEYDGGWFFGDNGISEGYAEAIDKVITMPLEASALYLSATENAAEIEYTLSELSRIAAEVTAYAGSDYEKARLLCGWVADNIYYDMDAFSSSVTNQTIALYNVLKTRRTVCAGFANLYAALLEAVGIRAVNIKGCVITNEEVVYENLAEGGENHEWCAFYYEAERRWVLADACWNTGNKYIKGEYIRTIPHEKYFDIAPLAFSLNHRADKAEQRAYFDALDYVIANPPASARETAAISENNESDDETVDSKATDTAADDENSSVLYAAVAILSAGAVAAAYFLVFTLYKERKRR